MKTIQYLIAGMLILMSAACKGSKEIQNTDMEESTEGAMATALPSGNQSLFWQIRGNGLEKPSYLYGTIHVIGAEDYFLGENVQQKLQEADRLVMEIDFDEMDMMALASAGLLPDNTSMRDYLSPEDYAFAATILSDSIGLSRTSFETAYARMKPVFLQQLIIYKFLGENPMSYETNFNQYAETHNIESSGLETIQEQLAFLDQLPLEEQFSDLLDALRNWKETETQFKEMLGAYKNQDLDALNYLIEVEMERPEMRELLLDKRNTKWIPQLKEWIEEGNAFIAVGAGHLAGDSGVIFLLRNAGYEVWPYPTGKDIH